MRTGYACMRLGIIAYIVPFVFVYDPLLLLQGPPLLVALALVTATLGTLSIVIGMIGYFTRPAAWFSRILLVIGRMGLLIPPGGSIAYSAAINGVGLAVCLGIIIREWRAKNNLRISEAPEKLMTEG